MKLHLISTYQNISVWTWINYNLQEFIGGQLILIWLPNNNKDCMLCIVLPQTPLTFYDQGTYYCHTKNSSDEGHINP